MKRLPRIKIDVGSKWVDNQTGEVVTITSVAPNSVRYSLEDLPGMVLGRYRRGFLEDFTPKKKGLFT